MKHENDNFPRFFLAREDYPENHDAVSVICDARHTVSSFIEWLRDEADDDRVLLKPAMLFTSDIVDLGEFDELSDAVEGVEPHELWLLGKSPSDTYAQISGELLCGGKTTVSILLDIVVALRSLHDLGPENGRDQRPRQAIGLFLAASGLQGCRR